MSARSGARWPRGSGSPPAQADDLSRWALACPGQFDASDLRCWRIASASWLALADEQLDPVDRVERPVGLFVVPALTGGGWQLSPVLSLDAIRLIVALGGRLERDLRAATIPGDQARRARRARQRAHAARRTQGAARQRRPARPRALARARADRLARARRATSATAGDACSSSAAAYKHTSGPEQVELGLRVITFPARGFTQRRLGAARRDDRHAQRSAVMELGEAIQTAVDAGLPLLLSTEAAGQLKDTVRIGRMKGRPGMLTITTSDGLSASTRRVVAEQAISRLRALKNGGANVTLDAGARQAVRMTLARPLADDPVLLGRQQQIAALKVVGSGVDASQVGTGKTVSTGRALAHRAATTPRLRAMVVAEGRLLSQWRDELQRGAPGRGLPPLAPNLAVLVLDDRRSVAAQVRAFDRELGDRPGVALVANSLLDRHPAELEVIPWHLLVADEALRYANPATEAHQALRHVRMNSVADCWLLTATPRGKSAEALDVLVGLALGDEAMIDERLNTREAGDLMDEINAHRLRVNYGPHLVRVTRQDMQQWMPQVRPAEPIALDGDPALAELLDAIRHGGREAYRRLLDVLRELKTLEAGSAPVHAGDGRARARPGRRAGQRRRVRGRQRRPGDAHPLAGGARAGARPPRAGGGGDARRRRRAAAAARRDRADAGRSRRRGAGDRVRRAGVVPAPARPHPARRPRRRGARGRRRHHPGGLRGAQAALHRAASSRCCACRASARRGTTSRTRRA